MSSRYNQEKKKNNLPTLNYFYTFYVSIQTFSSKLKIKKQNQKAKKKKEIYVEKNVMAYTSFELFHLMIIVN